MQSVWNLRFAPRFRCALVAGAALAFAWPAAGAEPGEPPKPSALTRTMARFGHRVRWQTATKREKSQTLAGRIVWPKRRDGKPDAVEVYDFGSAEIAEIQAEQIAAGLESTGEGFQGVVSGRWLYTGDEMRIGIVADGLKAAGSPGKLYSAGKRSAPPVK